MRLRLRLRRRSAVFSGGKLGRAEKRRVFLPESDSPGSELKAAGGWTQTRVSAFLRLKRGFALTDNETLSVFLQEVCVCVCVCGAAAVDAAEKHRFSTWSVCEPFLNNSADKRRRCAFNI